MNSPAPVALRSTPLRVMVRRAERGRRLLAWALIAPSLVFVLAAFAAPIALFLFRSVANPEVPGTLRRTLARLREWDGRDLPDERAYAALAADLKAVADSPDVAVLARRLNYNVPGFRTLVIRTARDGAAAVAVAVQDSGIGIDEKQVERLFRPLFTTKAEGLGMGLAIARTIVDAHGGRLGAANNVHGGATFHFTLPVDTEERP